MAHMMSSHSFSADRFMMIILYQIFESTDVATMLNKKELNYSTVTLCFIAILVSAEGEQTTPTGIAIVSLTSN